MIRRDPAAAAEATYDLAIVGGGAHGVALCLEAARRGMKTLLVERSDFGAETSWNSLRIVHGGLRYLQNLDLGRFRESVTERSHLLRQYPDLVRPLSCVMPLYGRGLRRPFVLRAALALNDRLSAGRNRGLPPGHRIGRGRVLTARETRELCPGVRSEGLTGGVQWFDAASPDSQRLLIEMLHWAAACGAEALNYVEAEEPVSRQGKIVGLVTRDLTNGERIEFAARSVVNCAGPWCRDVARAFDRDVPHLFRRAVGLNVLLDVAPPSEHAIALDTRDAGTLFLHPWKGRILAGTYHAACPDDAGAGLERPAHELIERLAEVAPQLGVTPEAILRVHWGYLPAQRSGAAHPARHDVVHDHGAQGGLGGLYSVSGVKFTTARSVARKVLVAASRGARLPAYLPVERPPSIEWWSAATLDPHLARDVNPLAAAARRLIENEAVVHLDDLLLRRTDWGVDPQLGTRVGERLAPLLGWDAARTRNEVDQLERKLVRA
ncbi:MAG: FAD-dependent oxidoreductase [bacterium]|nr:FAD-dependent oxidoreductase [bacterium]